jgi:hypothetical protein
LLGMIGDVAVEPDDAVDVHGVEGPGGDQGLKQGGGRPARAGIRRIRRGTHRRAGREPPCVCRRACSRAGSGRWPCGWRWWSARRRGWGHTVSRPPAVANASAAASSAILARAATTRAHSSWWAWVIAARTSTRLTGPAAPRPWRCRPSIPGRRA